MTDAELSRTTVPTVVPGSVLTYRGPAHTGAPRLTDLPGVGGVQPVADAEVRELERFDTTDLRLFSAGIELAVERVTPDRGGPATPTATWVLRLPDGGPDERLAVPLEAGGVEGVDPGEVPGEIDALVRRVRGSGELHPVGRTRVVRASTRLTDGGGVELALLHRDQVQVATLGAATAVESWSEAAVHPGTAGTALLQRVDEALRATGMTRGPGVARTRLTELLAEAAPADPPRRTGRKGSAGALLLDYLGEKVDALTERERDLRADRPDAVHQMRVNARRMRSALRTYGRLLEGPRVPHLVAELRWLGRALAGERDAEVQEERLTGRLGELAPELLLGPVQAQTTRHFARTRAEARAAVMEVVDGERYAALLGALRRLLADPPLSSRAASPARKVLPGMAGRTAKKLDRRMGAALAELSEPSGDRADGAAAESLHRARKTGKQLRYATEVVRPVAGKDARAFVKRLKGVQQILGDHQDAVVARETLRLLGAQAGAESRNGFTFGVLHGLDTARMRELEQQLPGVWEQAWTRRARRWMRR